MCALFDTFLVRLARRERLKTSVLVHFRTNSIHTTYLLAHFMESYDPSHVFLYQGQ